MLLPKPPSSFVRVSRSLLPGSIQHRRSNSTVEPPPAGGHLPSIATSDILKTKRETALRTPGISWADESSSAPPRTIIGGRETRKMNTYQAIRDAMSIALATDENAVVFGEDVAFGGVFRCSMVCFLSLLIFAFLTSSTINRGLPKNLVRSFSTELTIRPHREFNRKGTRLQYPLDRTGNCGFWHRTRTHGSHGHS